MFLAGMFTNIHLRVNYRDVLDAYHMKDVRYTVAELCSRPWQKLLINLKNFI